jgi:hypothetical protein
MRVLIKFIQMHTTHTDGCTMHIYLNVYITLKLMNDFISKLRVKNYNCSVYMMWAKDYFVQLFEITSRPCFDYFLLKHAIIIEFRIDPTF